MVGFVGSALLLLFLKLIFRNPKLYVPPEGDDQPPGWIRTVLIGTCGGVSFAHGSNDGQKGMGLLLLVLIGFFPLHYALTVNEPERAETVFAAVGELREDYQKAGIEMSEQLDKEPERDRDGAEGQGDIRGAAARQGHALGGAAGDRGRRSRV